jgi:hypothetical protein
MFHAYVNRTGKEKRYTILEDPVLIQQGVQLANATVLILAPLDKACYCAGSVDTGAR